MPLSRSVFNNNLVYRGGIPVMIGAFIDPGVTVSDGKSIRQEEYDSLGDRHSKVIVEELLPALYKDYKISRDPERHGIAGWSSGAIRTGCNQGLIEPVKKRLGDRRTGMPHRETPGVPRHLEGNL